MNDMTEQACEQARFAAREFVARFAREMGSELPILVVERMSFAFEIGYLAGRSDGVKSALRLFDGLKKGEV